jgi:hypothetical protein
LVNDIVKRTDYGVTVPDHFVPPETYKPLAPATSIALLELYKEFYPGVISNRLLFFAAVEAGNKPAVKWLLEKVTPLQNMSLVDQHIMLNIAVRHLFSDEGDNPEGSIFKMLAESLDDGRRTQLLNLRVRREPVGVREGRVRGTRHLYHVNNPWTHPDNPVFVSFNSLQDSVFPDGDPSMIHPELLEGGNRIKRELENSASAAPFSGRVNSLCLSSATQFR